LLRAAVEMVDVIPPCEVLWRFTRDDEDADPEADPESEADVEAFIPDPARYPPNEGYILPVGR
jgi:hypothetical protein